MGHRLWMILGCVLPLLLIFLAPAFGIQGDWGLFLFIGLMFVCHLVMIRGHSHQRRGVDSEITQEGGNRDDTASG